jgi:GMP synthase-like glutamine amidotransferase
VPSSRYCISMLKLPEGPAPARKVLIVLHHKDSTSGRLGRLLRRQGYGLDCRRPPYDDPLPKTLKDYAGVIIFGGSMSANDQHAWIRREIGWIDVPLKEKVPFIGICLGAQMLARHLGHRVQPHAEGRVEIGYYPSVCANAHFRGTFINGTARDSTSPAGHRCLPRARILRRRHSATMKAPMAFNSTPR